jgi:hypothetical protein
VFAGATRQRAGAVHDASRLSAATRPSGQQGRAGRHVRRLGILLQSGSRFSRCHITLTESASACISPLASCRRYLAISNPSLCSVHNLRHASAFAQRAGLCWLLERSCSLLPQLGSSAEQASFSATAFEHFDLAGVPANSPQTGEYIAMIRRNIEDAVQQALADTPVVLLNGARQTGKTEGQL